MTLEVEPNEQSGGLQEEQVEEPKLRSCLSSGSLKGLGSRVSFSKIEIREYERTVGGNIASSGVPLSLGWKYDSAGELDLESYEKHRPPSRSQQEMKLPAHIRNDILRDFGFSRAERMAATKQSNIDRNRRLATATKTAELSKAEYVLEKAGRSMKKVLNPKVAKTKSKEKDEIARLIRKDRLKASWRDQLRRANSCPTLDISCISDDASSVASELQTQSVGEPETRASEGMVEENNHQQESDDDWFVGEEC